MMYAYLIIWDILIQNSIKYKVMSLNIFCKINLHAIPVLDTDIWVKINK